MVTLPNRRAGEIPELPPMPPYSSAPAVLEQALPSLPAPPMQIGLRHRLPAAVLKARGMPLLRLRTAPAGRPRLPPVAPPSQPMQKVTPNKPRQRRQTVHPALPRLKPLRAPVRRRRRQAASAPLHLPIAPPMTRPQPQATPPTPATQNSMRRPPRPTRRAALRRRPRRKRWQPGLSWRPRLWHLAIF